MSTVLNYSANINVLWQFSARFHLFSHSIIQTKDSLFSSAILVAHKDTRHTRKSDNALRGKFSLAFFSVREIFHKSRMRVLHTAYAG